MDASSETRASSSNQPSPPAADIPMYHAPHQVNYRALISLLSRSPYLPSSIHVRNTLLSGLMVWEDMERSLEEALQVRSRTNQKQEDKEEDEDEEIWWQILEEYQPGIQVILFGDVPSEVLNYPPTSDVDAVRNGQGEEASRCLWGIGILKAPCARRRGDIASHFIHLDLSLWLSSESLAQASRREEGESNWILPPLEPQMIHLNILDLILRNWFPEAVRRFRKRVVERFLSLDSSWSNDDVDDEAKVVLDEGPEEIHFIAFALGELERKALYALSHRDATTATSTGGGGGGGVQTRGKVEVAWQNNCYTFQDGRWSGEEDAVEVEEDRWLRAEGGNRWKMERIEEATTPLVQSANHLPFPASHILRKPFLTCLLRDQLGPSLPSDLTGPCPVPNNDYAKAQGSGCVAGWVYTHEDMSLASLHVPEAYRRLGSAATTSGAVAERGDAETDLTTPRLSIGRMLVSLLSPRIARQQRGALRLLDIDVPQPPSAAEAGGPSAWPIVAESELDNQGAEMFYRKCGFEVTGKHSWLGVKAWI